jgi:site-specific DNA recombinase
MNLRPIRCAIYTRKSSEEGLEQEFNSLAAQREACAAYVQSQKHEGWKLLPNSYDDGGFSGGTMDRPALRQLLAAIDAGSVDLVVVYKVDRLTRALTDFAKIVERFDAKGISFVSVTQAFNTTTSMGRLTLNVLLSFAQFEREVTGERIRDKIAASKRKGMWMGGTVPLGYDVKDRHLVVNANEAEQVRHIYDRYVKLANVDALRRELLAGGYRGKVRHRNGRSSDGLSNGALTCVLANPIYRGLIVHRGELHAGQHQAIVSEELWNGVREVMEQRKRTNTSVPRARGRNPLLGLLTDEAQRTYYATYTKKRGHAPYRYYVTKSEEENRRRLPASELENHVLAALAGYFRNQQQVIDDLALTSGIDLTSTLSSLTQLLKIDDVDRWARFRPLLVSVVHFDDRLLIAIDRPALAQALGIEIAPGPPIQLSHPMRLHRTGNDIRLVIPKDQGEPDASKVDLRLIKFIARGRRWYRTLTADNELSPTSRKMSR